MDLEYLDLDPGSETHIQNFKKWISNYKLIFWKLSLSTNKLGNHKEAYHHIVMMLVHIIVASILRSLSIEKFNFLYAFNLIANKTTKKL